MPEQFVGHIGDVTALDKVALVVLCVIMVSVGVYPSVMVPIVESGVNGVLALLGGV